MPVRLAPEGADGLVWVSAVDACRLFALTPKRLARYVNEGTLQAKAFGTRTFLYKRADLESVTRAAPKFDRLSMTGAIAYCLSRWKVTVTSAELCKARKSGNLKGEKIGPKNYLYERRSIDAWCNVPAIDGDEYVDGQGTWLIERAACERMRCSPSKLIGWRSRRHPLLDRKLKSKQVKVRQTGRDQRRTIRTLWLWLLADVEAVVRLNEAFESRRQNQRIAAAKGESLARPDARGECWLTAREVELEYGWARHTIEHYGKTCGLLDGKRIAWEKQLRSQEGGRYVQPVAVYKKSDCDRAKARETAGHPEGLMRVVDAANTLGIPPETLYKWEQCICPALGRVVKMTRLYGADAKGRRRPTVYMRREDFDRIRVALCATTQGNAFIAINEAAQTFDLSPHVLRDALRRPHAALGRLIETGKQVGPTNDTAANRRRKHRRRRLLVALPIADVETIARWYAKRDGKPHGLNRATVEVEAPAGITNQQAPASNGVTKGRPRDADVERMCQTGYDLFCSGMKWSVVRSRLEAMFGKRAPKTPENCATYIKRYAKGKNLTIARPT